MSLTRRPLGQSPLAIAPLAFGGNVFGWSADETTSFALLDAFVDAGLDLVDTADSYSYWAPGNEGGESERILGRWLRRSGPGCHRPTSSRRSTTSLPATAPRRRRSRWPG